MVQRLRRRIEEPLPQVRLANFPLPEYQHLRFSNRRGVGLLRLADVFENALSVASADQFLGQRDTRPLEVERLQPPAVLRDHLDPRIGDLFAPPEVERLQPG